MTLKRLIVSQAYALTQLLEHCEDSHFIDAIISAVTYCDYAALDELEDMQEDDHAQTD